MIDAGLPDEVADDGPRLDLTPLIDVVFMLIVFLLLTASASQLVLAVDTPQSESVETSESEALILYPPESVDGLWSLDGADYNDDDAVVEAIQNALEQEPERSLLIGIDERVSSQRLVDAMDLSRRAGVESVEIAVERGGT